LNDQVQEQKEYYYAALQQARELDLLALVPEYGNALEEVATLKKLVRLHEEKNLVVQEEHRKLQKERPFYKEWYYWNLQAIRATHAEKKRMGPKPKLSDYLSIERSS